MTVVIFGTEMGVPVAEIESYSEIRVNIIDDRFKVESISTVTAQDDIEEIFK